MKKLFILSILLIMNLSILSYGEKAIHIIVNEKPIDLKDAAAFVDPNGSTLVPIRFVADNLGARTFWDDKTQIATITKKQKKIEIRILEKKILIDGTVFETKSHGMIRDARTYVPLRLIAEGFDADVNYDHKSKTVNIITNDITLPTPPEKEVPKTPTDPFKKLGITETPLRYKELGLKDAGEKDLQIAKTALGKFWKDNYKVYSAKAGDIPDLNLTVDFATSEQTGLLNNYTMSIDAIVLADGQIIESCLSLPNMSLFGMNLNYDPKDALDLIGKEVDKIVLDLPFDHDLKQFPLIVVDVENFVIQKTDSQLQKHRGK